MGRNERLHRARLKMRWSQEKAAEEAKIARKTYIELETGKRTPQIGTLDLLCLAFDASPQALGYNELGQILVEDPLTSVGSVVPDQSDGLIVLTNEQAEWIVHLLNLEEKNMASSFDPSKRAALVKILGKAGGVLAATYLLDTEPWERMGKPANLNSGTFTSIEKLMESCWELSNGSELRMAEGILPQFLPRVITLASQPSQYQKRAATIASQGLQLKSILVAHRLGLEEKIALCNQAVEYARLAGDYNTLALALIQLATAYHYANKPVQALQAYEESLSYINHITPLLQGRTYIGASEAYAKCGLKQEALRCISLAHELFPKHPQEDPTFIYADTGPFSLALHGGQALLALNQTNEALKIFTQFEDTQQAYGIVTAERNRLEIKNQQGKAAMVTGNLDQYAVYLEEGLVGAMAIKSQKRYNEVIEIYQQIPQQWTQEAAIKRITKQYKMLSLN